MTLSESDWKRTYTAADVRQGDFIEAYDHYGEVVKIHGPNRKIGDGTIDWFTFHVLFEDEHGRKDAARTTVGPWRADRLVVARDRKAA